MVYNGKIFLLPPKSPSPACTDYILSSTICYEALPKPRDENLHHQCTSSESVLLEEPWWLDDLLNEPESPACKGDHTSMGIIKNKKWDPLLGLFEPAHGHPSLWGHSFVPYVWSLFPPQDADWHSSPSNEKQGHVETGAQDPKGAAYKKKDASQVKPSSSETDTKHANQQFAQRSRVRKRQYIAELETNVQALQAKISEVSAEIKFLNQHNLISNMRNKALEQHLETLAHEHLIKHLEYEVLNREVGRLRSLYWQQTSPPQNQ